jgi:hypothetical protein
VGGGRGEPESGKIFFWGRDHAKSFLPGGERKIRDAPSESPTAFRPPFETDNTGENA